MAHVCEQLAHCPQLLHNNAQPGVEFTTFQSLVWHHLLHIRSLISELSLSCARPAADGWPLMWVNHLVQVSQPGRLSLSSFQG